MGGGQSGGSSPNQVVQVQQIPQFEQDFAQHNQQLAQSLAAQPYPTYQAPLLAGFTPQQFQGMGMATGAASAYQPDLAAAEATTQGALNSGNFTNFANAASNAAGAGMNGAPVYGAMQSAAGLVGNALGAAANNPGVIQSYMNPYLQASLNPQIANLNQEIGIQQLANNAGAAQAGAFGDARQGVAQGLTNYYGDQALNQLVGQGYNTAFNNALSAAQQQQAFGLQGANTLGQLGQLGLGEQQAQLSGGNLLSNLAQQAQQQQQLQLAGGQQLANLGQLQQQLGLTGANALYGTGALQQQQQQQALNLAYQQFQNQVQWPFQLLNVRESALSNSPYNIVNQTTLPNANQLATGLGAFGSLASILGSSGNGGNLAPFGGQALQ